MPVDLDLFEPFDRLVRIEFMGRTFEVPDSNSLLRALQYIAAESIAYGRFCWNDECGNCEVTCLSVEGESVVVRACQETVRPDMKITAVSEDLEMVLDRED